MYDLIIIILYKQNRRTMYTRYTKGGMLSQAIKKNTAHADEEVISGNVLSLLTVIM